MCIIYTKYFVVNRDEEGYKKSISKIRTYIMCVQGIHMYIPKMMFINYLIKFPVGF